MKRHITSICAQILIAAILIAGSIVRTSAQSEAPKPGFRATVGKSKAALSYARKYEKEGVAIDLTIDSLPNEMGRNNGLVHSANALVTFRLTDVRTGQPLTGLHPAAWLDANASGRVPVESECKDKVRTYAGGLLSARADLDLNSYLMLTLNHDNTITFINPQVSFSKTKLESIIELPGRGVDWVLSSDKNSLYVTLPEQSAVAIVSTITKKLTATLPMGEKTKPVRLALEPGGRNVWVGLDGTESVVAIDTASNKVAGIVPAGAGLHNIAFAPDGRFAYVTNSGADTVSVINTKSFEKVADLKVGKTPVPVAYSSASRMIYVSAINGDTISVIDPAKQEIVATVPSKRGVVAMRFEPKGRFGFLVNQVDSTVSILDAATNTILNSVAVVSQPDQVVFTSGYAYIRGTASEKITLLDLTLAGKEKISPVEITAGRLPPNNLPQEIGVSDMIIPTPEGNAVMIANGPDQMIYYYVEGMMAPMGTFTNYKRRPQALLMLDRSLSEKEPGVYSTLIKLPPAGHYDVPFLLNQPLVINCFQLDIAESPEDVKSVEDSIAVEFLFKDKQLALTEANSLRIKLTDLTTKKPIAGLKDVQVLVFEPPGIWQQRQLASEVEPGVYEIMQTFPESAAYRVMLSIASRGKSFADLPSAAVSVNATAPTEEKNPD
jgi:YVTN family beta-propeller protein